MVSVKLWSFDEPVLCVLLYNSGLLSLFRAIWFSYLSQTSDSFVMFITQFLFIIPKKNQMQKQMATMVTIANIHLSTQYLTLI